MEVIKESSWIKILVMMKSLCRLDLRNLNTFQMMALIKLNQFGLDREHVKNLHWFNSIAHVNQLVSLMSDEKIVPEVAVKKLQDQYSPPALVIAQSPAP